MLATHSTGRCLRGQNLGYFENENLLITPHNPMGLCYRPRPCRITQEMACTVVKSVNPLHPAIIFVSAGLTCKNENPAPMVDIYRMFLQPAIHRELSLG